MEYEYHIRFRRHLKLSPIATPEQVLYIQNFAKTRRIKRDSAILMKRFNGEYGLNGNYGIEGEFYVGGEDAFSPDKDYSILDFDNPSSNQFSLKCEWTVTDDGKKLVWTKNELFYEYLNWLNYMIDNFFIPWNIKLNGTLTYQGQQEKEDAGIITVKNNIVSLEYL